VLAYSPDRLSRKYAYQILLIERVSPAHGVETLFCEVAARRQRGRSTPGSVPKAMIAEYERAQILGAIRAAAKRPPGALGRDQA